MMMIISMIRFALLKLGWYFFGMARTKLGCSVKWYSLMGLYFKCDTGKMVGLIFKCTHTNMYIYIYVWIVRGPFFDIVDYMYVFQYAVWMNMHINMIFICAMRATLLLIHFYMWACVLHVKGSHMNPFWLSLPQLFWPLTASCGS